MTNEQINIAIAEACGWEPRKDTDGNIIAWQSPGAYRAFSPDDLPDYCNDLNAMRDAWLSLSEEDKFVFDKELQRIILKAKDGQYWLTNATALQRAEAFLRVFGKWKE